MIRTKYLASAATAAIAALAFSSPAAAQSIGVSTDVAVGVQPTNVTTNTSLGGRVDIKQSLTPEMKAKLAADAEAKYQAELARVKAEEKAYTEATAATEMKIEPGAHIVDYSGKTHAVIDKMLTDKKGAVTGIRVKLASGKKIDIPAADLRAEGNVLTTVRTF